MSFQDEFPPIENAPEMDPEELAPFILKYLSTRENTGKMNRYNFTLGTDPELTSYAGKHRKDFCGNPNRIIINESGLYRLIMRSNMPIA